MTVVAGTTRSSSRVAPDRQALPLALLAVIAVATAASVGAAVSLLPTEAGSPATAMAGGVLAGALAVLALRSVSVRTTARWMCIIGALLALRFGTLSTDELSGPVTALVWVVATTAALVTAEAAARSRHRRPVVRGARSGRLPRVVVVVACFAAAAAIGVGPTVSTAFSSGGRPGELPDGRYRESGNAMAATDRLDMTRRPRLGNTVVMTVASPAPGFWRNQTFDTWDGSAWTRSDPALTQVGPSGRITAPEDHLDRDDRRTVTEDFRIEAPFANALPLSPTPVSVTAPSTLLQWTDGSVAAPQGLGRGAAYRVVSRRFEQLSAGQLRAAGSSVPADVSARYAAPPIATDRVEALAAELAQGATTDFDKVLAVESWLDDHTSYSLQAPLAPEGADVVDDFLFVSKVGWCEQIASSLTVLLRLQGVPARLATGYVPGRRDPVTGRYRVLEADAHAWTEVWFPEVGWVPFDPTAGVPLSGIADEDDVVGAIARYGPVVLLAAGLIVALGGVVMGGVRRVLRAVRTWARSRRDRRGRERTDDWPIVTEVELERVGARWGRPRAPAETTTAYATVLSRRTGDERLVAVGVIVDRARFGAVAPSDEERAAVVAVLESVPPPS